MILGISSEDCKRKWKNMRDRYLKEVRMENKSKKQGEVFQSRWKYRQLMNFIAPFAGSRSGGPDMGGSNDDEHDNLDNESNSPGGDMASPEPVKTLQSLVKSVSHQDIKPQVPFVTQSPSIHQDTQPSQLALGNKTPSSSLINKTGRKRRLIPDPHSLNSSLESPTKWLVKDNGASFPNRPRDEDELFLLSFVPALKRLAPQKRCETKMKIQQIMYEAEFNVAQAEPQDKQAEPETHD